MAYVPVNLWVPDTTSGPVTESVNLKPCETCHATIPEQLMTAHQEESHPVGEVTPH